MIKSLSLAAALIGAGGVALVATGDRSPQGSASANAKSYVPATASNPVVIELFQSQGCSSCPPALAVLDKEADRGDVIALNFAVTYWDRLGWKDIYAKPEFTARQWDYARAGKRGNVYTPQVIVAGKQALVGSTRGQVDKAIAAAQSQSGPAITRSPGSVRIAAGVAPKKATVWLVDYDPRRVDVAIRAGENGGRTLPHRNIVRTLTALGQWSGPAVQFRLPPVSAGLRRVVLVQEPGGGPILSAARL